MNMMTPRMTKITFTAVFDPPPRGMGPAVGAGAFTSGGAMTVSDSTTVPHLGQKRAPSPRALPQLTQNAAMKPSLQCRAIFPRTRRARKMKSRAAPRRPSGAKLAELYGGKRSFAHLALGGHWGRSLLPLCAGGVHACLSGDARGAAEGLQRFRRQNRGCGPRGSHSRFNHRRPAAQEIRR